MLDDSIGFLPPIAHMAAIERHTLNRALIEWGHKMGPWERPDFGKARFHGLHHNGKLVAVTATDQLIVQTVAGFQRHQAIELGRLCAARPDLCRAMLRLWRAFVFPALGHQWAISYQDAVEHTGNTYRLDGWISLGESRSGTDKRGKRRGRSKIIWGWCANPAEMQNIKNEKRLIAEAKEDAKAKKRQAA